MRVVYNSISIENESKKVIDEDIIEYVKERRDAGEKVIGLTAAGTVCVGK